MVFFSNHDQYKKHLTKLFKIQGQVDHSKPESLNFTHLRSNTYKMDMNRLRDMKRENDSLVIKILKLRNSKNNSQKSLHRSSLSQRRQGSTIRRSGSVRSLNSTGTKGKRNSSMESSRPLGFRGSKLINIASI
jgi:hypothetical protein